MVILTRFSKAFRPFSPYESAWAALILIAFAVLLQLSACQALQGTSPAGTAQAALEAAVQDYEKGSLKSLEAMLPASFVGRESMLDAARRAVNEQRQTRIELIDVKTQGSAGSSPQALSLRWEKRFVRASSGAAALERGSMQLVLRRTGSAANPVWLIESMNADNVFTRS